MLDQSDRGLQFLCQEYVEEVVHWVSCVQVGYECDQIIYDQSGPPTEVNPWWLRPKLSLQLLSSHHIRAIQPSRLVDPVNCETLLGSHWVLSSFKWTMWEVSGMCWLKSTNGLHRHIGTNYDGASGCDFKLQRYWFESKLAEVNVSLSKQRSTPAIMGKEKYKVNWQSVIFRMQNIYLLIS